MKKADLQKESPRVLKLFTELLVAIFVIESLIMVLLHIFIEPSHLSAVAKGFLDSFSLVIFIFPILYLLFYRPLSLEIASYKQALERVQNLESSYNIIIQAAMDGFWLTDTQGRILDVNDAYGRLTGYTRQELLRMSVPDLEAMETTEETTLHIRKIKETGADRFETKHRGKDGRIVDMEISVNYLTGDGGRFFAFLRDITERKKVEEELLRANQELLELDRMKSEFINMASHELRTPIAITREGISQVVEGLRGEIPAQQKRFLSISLSNVDRLVKIVDSIFDVSEIEYTRSELNREVTDILALAGKVIANFSQQAKNKGLEIKQSFPEEKIELSIDKERIKQVFANLISNAFDFTDQGSIEIKIQEKDTAIECSVSDTGRGIPEDMLPTIFDKFQQSGKGYGPGAKGVGLGLAIAKAIVERHKGKIWVESKPGQGATFTFTLPKENTK